MSNKPNLPIETVNELIAERENISFFNRCKDRHLEKFKNKLLKGKRQLTVDEDEQESFQKFEEQLKNSRISIGVWGFGHAETVFDFKKHFWSYDSLSYRHHFGKRLDNKESRKHKTGTIPLKAEKEFASRLYFVYKLEKGHYEYEAHCCDASTTTASIGETGFSWIRMTTFGLAFNPQRHTDGCRDHNDNQTGKATRKWLENALYSELFDQIRYAFDRLKYACEHPDDEYPEDAFEIVRDFRQKAIENYEKMALQGNIQAIRHLAELKYYGVYLRKNKKQALELYKKAAEGNDASALLMLADLYYDGTETEQDYHTAASLYRKYLVKTGLRRNPDYAWYKLGLMYRDGKGVRKNDRRAALLFKKAKLYRYKPATWEYALCLYYGRGVKQNKNKALDIAVNRFTVSQTRAFIQIIESEPKPLDKEALFGLGRLYKTLIYHDPWEEDKYTIEEKEIIFKANLLICKAAESGLIEAEEQVAYIISEGGGEIGLPQDENKAVEWYTKAANQGSDHAKYMLATYYLNGTFDYLFGKKRDNISLETARYWFKQMSKEKRREYSSIAKSISDAMYREKKKKGMV